MSWGHFPSDWVRYGNVLRTLPVGVGASGRTIHALKLYLAVAGNVDYATRSVQMTYTDFVMITGVSRPRIRPAIDMLVQHGLLQVDASTYVQTYILPPNSSGKISHAKVAQDAVLNCLRNIPNSGSKSARALKHLILMLAHASDTPRGHSVRLSHDRFIEYCATPPGAVAQINTIVGAAGFLRLVRAEPTDGGAYSSNEYVLLGDYAGANYRRAPLPSTSTRKERKGRRPVARRASGTTQPNTAILQPSHVARSDMDDTPF